MGKFSLPAHMDEPHTEIPQKLENVPIWVPKPTKTYSNKTYTETRGLVRLMWTCAFSLIAITVFEKLQNKTHTQTSSA